MYNICFFTKKRFLYEVEFNTFTLFHQSPEDSRYKLASLLLMSIIIVTRLQDKIPEIAQFDATNIIIY